MTNNDVLRRLCYALNMNDTTTMQILKLTGHEIAQSTVTAFFKKEGEKGHIECSDKILLAFCDGLICHKRGKKGEPPGQSKEMSDPPITNNLILKKMRIALDLKEPDMLEILKLAKVEISKSEIAALFRREGHKNYRKCGDQFLQGFIAGVAIRQGRLQKQASSKNS